MEVKYFVGAALLSLPLRYARRGPFFSLWTYSISRTRGAKEIHIANAVCQISPIANPPRMRPLPIFLIAPPYNRRGVGFFV